MTTPLTVLRLQPGCTTLADGAGPEVVIGVGVDDLARRVFRPDPPTAVEIERAIDLVEDALGASGLRHGERGEPGIAHPPLLAALGLVARGMRLSREEVKARFERLAAAALLILRECLHHLGYAGVRRAAS